MTAARDARLAKHSLSIAGHRTSVSLETVFWTALGAIAARRGQTVAALVACIDRDRGDANLSSAIRVFVLETATRLPDLAPVDQGSELRLTAAGFALLPVGEKVADRPDEGLSSSDWHPSSALRAPSPRTRGEGATLDGSCINLSSEP